LLCITLL